MPAPSQWATRMPELLRLYGEGLTRKAIAEQLGVPEGAVASIIKRKGLATRKPTSGKPKDFVPKVRVPKVRTPKPRRPRPPKPRKERPKAIPPKVKTTPKKKKKKKKKVYTDERPLAELEAEIVKIRDETVASRCKVDGPEWLAAVRRCKELRSVIRSRNPRWRYRENSGRKVPGGVANIWDKDREINDDPS